MVKRINNNKGQALVEFVLIMPIFIFLIMAMVDLGNIIYKKYNLENTLDTVVELYEQGENQKMAAYVTAENINLDITDAGEDLTKVSISKDINIITPGLNNILGKNYTLSVDRTVYSTKGVVTNAG
jgi:Flp pilus assembly protein TadG